MATRNWIGNAVATKDVWTITVANTWATGDTGTITINGKDLVVTIGSLVTTAQVATTLKEAWESGTFTDTTASKIPQGGGTSIPEMSELTATVSGSTVILTADTAGVPHTISVSESTAGSGTLSITHTTTATGPNYWNNTDNWAEGSIPTTGDDVVIDRPVSILYSLDNNGDTLSSLTIGERFSASSYIGLPFRTSTGYEEYREDQLKVGITTLTCRGASGRIKINVGSVQTTASIYSTGTSTDTSRAAFQFVGTHASNAVNVYAGDVSIAANDGETSTVATLKQTGGTLVCGSGATLTNVTKTGGTLTVRSSTTTLISNAGTTTISGGTQTAVSVGAGTCNIDGSTTVTTLRQSGGTVTSGVNVTLTTVDKSEGTITLNSGCTTFTSETGDATINAGSVTTANINGGTFYYGGTGTVGTLNASDCTLNFDSNTTAGCTVTTLNITAPVTIYDIAQRVTVTNNLPMPQGVLEYRNS